MRGRGWGSVPTGDALNQVRIDYRLRLGDHRIETFRFCLDGETFDLISEPVADPPKWTALAHHQCSHCPLQADQHPQCPLAVQMSRIAERFHDTRSIDKIELEVVTENRRVIQRLPIQNALASMLDLIVPICGCPKTAHLKPMARFHLPLASEEETVFRVTGMYLLSQYFLRQAAAGGSIEFRGLVDIYADLHIVNAGMAKRMYGISQSDSLKNAVTLIDMYSMLVPALLENQLSELRRFFEAYLPEVVNEPAATNYLELAKAFNLEVVPLEPQASEAADDGLPGWLRDLAARQEQETAAQHRNDERIQDEARRKQVAEDIIRKSGLSLELEQIEEAPGDGDDSPDCATHIVYPGRDG